MRNEVLAIFKNINKRQNGHESQPMVESTIKHPASSSWRSQRVNESHTDSPCSKQSASGSYGITNNYLKLRSDSKLFSPPVSFKKSFDTTKSCDTLHASGKGNQSGSSILMHDKVNPLGQNNKGKYEIGNSKSTLMLLKQLSGNMYNESPTCTVSTDKLGLHNHAFSRLKTKTQYNNAVSSNSFNKIIEASTNSHNEMTNSSDDFTISSIKGTVFKQHCSMDPVHNNELSLIESIKENNQQGNPELSIPSSSVINHIIEERNDYVSKSIKTAMTHEPCHKPRNQTITIEISPQSLLSMSLSKLDSSK